MHIKSILKHEPELAEKVCQIKEEPDTSFPVLSAKIKLTGRCNLACSMCTVHKKHLRYGSSKNSISLQLAVNILAELKKIGLRKIHFSGGEVLLLDYFPDLVACARKLDLQVNLTTNGTLITKDIARFFVEQRVHTVTVSIDASTAKEHDKIRGVKGAFKATLKGINYLKKRKKQKGRGPKIAVNTVVMRDNIEKLDEIFVVLNQIGVDAWRLLPVDSKIKKIKPLTEQWRDLSSLCEQWKPLLSQPSVSFLSKIDFFQASKGKYSGSFYKHNLCYAPWFNLFIDSDGKVYPCCMGKGDMTPYGNIWEQPFTNIINSHTRREIKCSMAAGHNFPVCGYCDDLLEENRVFNEC